MSYIMLRCSVSRISPLAWAKDAEGRSKSWSEVAKGEIRSLMATIESDKAGRFYGLGQLNRSLRKAGNLDRQHVRKLDEIFIYSESGERCTVQEAFFHYFGVPIPIITEPHRWYLFGWQPVIREVSDDDTRVLVDFIKDSPSGSCGGTSLYLVKGGKWAVFMIKPSDSGSIASAEAWLKKRGWKDWA